MSSESNRAAPPDPGLAALLGGRAGAVDASVPVVLFVAFWVLVDAPSPQPLSWAAGAAVAGAAVVGAVRLRQGRRPRAVLVALLGVLSAATLALLTGRPEDFFLLQLVSNGASALVWLVSIVVRWPLLGLVVGVLLGQRTRWRRDPDLVRGYQRASWAWVAQYVVRLALFVPFYLAGDVVLLAVTRTVVSPLLVVLSVAVSWPLLRTALPDDHPGIRHPR